MNDSDFFYNCRSGKVSPNEEGYPQSLELAYQIQLSNIDKFGEIGAWKLGGSTELTRRLFNTDRVYFGPVLANDIFGASENLFLNKQFQPVKGEVEVCFKLSDGIEKANLADVDEKSVNALIAEVMPAIELPWTPFSLPNAGLNVLVADRCASGSLIVGKSIAWQPEMRSQLGGEIVLLGSNESQLAHGKVENILPDPVSALVSFLRLAGQLGFPIKSGDLVSTGGCTPCVGLPLDSDLTIQFSNFLVGFEFSINSGEM